jgi:hypothetical protein
MFIDPDTNMPNLLFTSKIQNRSFITLILIKKSFKTSKNFEFEFKIMEID